MLADRIYGGTLTLGGRDNKAGIMKILNSSGAVMTTLDKDGILTNGRYTCGSDEFGRRAEISEGEIKIMDKSGNTVGRIFAVSNDILKSVLKMHYLECLRLARYMLIASHSV